MGCRVGFITAGQAGNSSTKCNKKPTRWLKQQTSWEVYGLKHDMFHVMGCWLVVGSMALKGESVCAMHHLDFPTPMDDKW